MGRSVGTVAKWLNHKGIGFITPEGSAEAGNDILVHFSQIKQEASFKSLAPGSSVEFDLKPDEKDPSKQVAVNVTGKDGADCEKKPKTRQSKSKGKGKKAKGGKKEKSDEEGEKDAEKAEE